MIPINIQPIEKRDKSLSGSSLDVHSIFYTIQGEGPFCGTPAIFIRLAGCNLQCPSCDTSYTQGRYESLISEIVHEVEVKNIEQKFLPLIVITGGEPFRQNILPLIRLLNQRGFKVQIETNGTLEPEESFNEYFHFVKNNSSNIIIVCSPKTGKIAKRIKEICQHYKYVMAYHSVNSQDGLPIFALDHTASPQVARVIDDNVVIYLQPADMQDEAVNKSNLEAVVKSCMKHGYILQLQTHKIIGVA